VSVIYLKDQDPFECFGIPAHVWELPPEVPPEERVPGADRRNWVYREMAMLGVDATLGLEVMTWLESAAGE
jgi:hypothetical protein